MEAFLEWQMVAACACISLSCLLHLTWMSRVVDVLPWTIEFRVAHMSAHPALFTSCIFFVRVEGSGLFCEGLGFWFLCEGLGFWVLL